MAGWTWSTTTTTTQAKITGVATEAWSCWLDPGAELEDIYEKVMVKQFESKCKGKKGAHLKDKDKDKDIRSRTWTRTARKVRRNSVARSSVLTLGKWVLWQEVSLDDLCHSYLDLCLNI